MNLVNDPVRQAKIEELQSQLEKLKILLDNQKKSKTDTTKDLIEYYNKDKSEIELPDAKLAFFLKIDPRNHSYRETIQTLEEGLRVNFEIRLFRETFYVIERAIL